MVQYLGCNSISWRPWEIKCIFYLTQTYPFMHPKSLITLVALCKGNLSPAYFISLYPYRQMDGKAWSDSAFSVLWMNRNRRGHIHHWGTVIQFPLLYLVSSFSARLLLTVISPWLLWQLIVTDPIIYVLQRVCCIFHGLSGTEGE